MAQANNSNNNDELAEQNQELQRQIAERNREIEELRAQLLAQYLLAQRDRQIEEPQPQLQAQQPADGGGVRRRRAAQERINYRRDLERFAELVDNELGNGRAPRPRPDGKKCRMQRVETIRTLNELKEKLDTICVGANYGKAVGNGAEIVGASGEMVGALLSLGGNPLGPMLMNSGKLLFLAGTLIDGTSNVIESVVSAKYLKDIEAVLKRDKELSLPLADWLDFSRELDAMVESIFGVSLASEKWKTVMKVFHELSKFSNSVTGFDATVSLMRQGRYGIYIGNDVNLEKLKMFFQQLSACPQFANKILVTLSILSNSTAAFQFFRDGARAYRFLMGTSSSVVLPSLQGVLNPDIPTARELTVFCGFQAISMAISVISLINAASIIRHGKSKYSDAIQELIIALQRELRQMEEL